MKEYKLVEATYLNNTKHTIIMTVQSTRQSLWGKLLRREPVVGNFKVVGSCTVWAFYPSFSCCSTSLEYRLYELWNKARTLNEIKAPLE